MIVYPGKAAGISGGFFRMRRISVLPTPAAAAGGTKFDAFSGSCADPIGGRKAHRLAGHRGVALLNDALLRWPFSGSLSGRIAQLVEQLTLNQRVPGSSPGAPTKQKAILSNSFERRRPRTKRVSCDAFCGRTSHAVRRADTVLKKPFDRIDAEACGGCWFQPRCEALVLLGSRAAGRRLLFTGEIRI
jgi:hypothetical protein